MQMAMRHLKAEDARKEAQSLGIMDVSKETARKVRQALDYMDRMGYTSAMVTGDPHLERRSHRLPGSASGACTRPC